MHLATVSNALRRCRRHCLPLATVFFTGWAVAGCSTLGTDTTLIYAQGCILYVDGAQITMAEVQERGWTFDEDCEIHVKSETGDSL